ncbi:MAG: ABC transporter permease [Clostridia bacterium]|nr:ABC transporter permease [Clostridia bacterium]
MVAYYAFTDKTGAFTFDNIAELPRYAKTFGISLVYSVEATIICLIIAYPLAYFMSNMKAGPKRMLSMLIMLPMWMNFLIRTYSWITILARTGIINTLLEKIGIGPLKLINTPGAIILGMVYNFLPYMVLPIYTAMLKLDHSLLEAADDLGASPFMRLRKVILPLSMPGVISGITMVFVPCVSTFYISQKLGGGKTMLIGDVIEMQFQSAYNYNLGAAISLILMVLILISLAVMNHFADKDDEEGGLIV